ncbi:hypothetical protein M9Y10_006644 [Tritrichomonas musculus]|uniref:F5/8 type C domain-containing protein n=1 Tax=Tritrichomonas musculus TaxID=1915356 RepID=A0ABR2JF87_9EUKA
MDFYLSSKSLKQIKESGMDEDFEIEIFCESIRCTKFIAMFFSPKISRVLRNDPTMDKFKVEFKEIPIIYRSVEEIRNKIEETNFVQKIRNLLEGEPIRVCNPSTMKRDEIEDTTKLLIELGIALDNEDIFFNLFKNFSKLDEKEMTKDNIIFNIKMSRMLTNKEIYKELIEKVSCNFSNFFSQEESDIEKLKELRVTELEDILSCPKLKIESEDFLYEMIEKLGEEYSILIDEIEIEYLSVENVKKIIEKIDNSEISLHRKLWSSICRRLILDPSRKNDNLNRRSVSNSQNQSIINCANGIIDHLMKESGGNVYSSKAIDVKSSRIFDGQIEHLFDKSRDTHFRLDDQSDGYIIFDFKDIRINFSKYYFSVPSSKNGQSNGRPKRWRIEGSNDENTWKLIDFKENDSNLNDSGKSSTFTCQTTNNEYYRYIRIKDFTSQTNTHYFLLSEIEFYGNINK